MDVITWPCVPTPETLDWLLDPIKENGQRSLFQLPEEFLQQYRRLQPAFGFNGMGCFVFQKSYSRDINGRNETWQETIQRVVEGTFEILKAYQMNVLHHQWMEDEAQELAQEMFARMFAFKLLPPGRGLQHMGTATLREKGLAAALNNTSFCSTRDLALDPIRPFAFAFDAQLLGCGVGFDVAGAGQVVVCKPMGEDEGETHIVEDSREGYVESIRVLLRSYFPNEDGNSAEVSTVSDEESGCDEEGDCLEKAVKHIRGGHGHRSPRVALPRVRFDYSLIRPAGQQLKTFGGVSSGPNPLRGLHEDMIKALEKNAGKPITTTTIADLFNLICRCVVSGNIRRTAQLALGPIDSTEFVQLKHPQINESRLNSHGWVSHISVVAPVGADYSALAESINVQKGEPGVIWLENMQNYSRMNGQMDRRDARVQGGPPCLEQSLEHMEFSGLAETFPAHHDSCEDFKETLRCALLYAKAVTLLSLHWPETHEVMHRNRRIGIGVSGIAQFLSKHQASVDPDGTVSLRSWLCEGYDFLKRWDAEVSQWLRIPTSIKLTCVKPSGTVSLLAGATPGVHFPISRYYIRRVRLSKASPLVDALERCGYPIEDSQPQTPETTVVVEFPVDVGSNVRTLDEVSMRDQLELTALLQECWADNQVSTTISYYEEEASLLAEVLRAYERRLKGVAFLCRQSWAQYKQIPYEPISEEVYWQRMRALKGVFQE